MTDRKPDRRHAELAEHLRLLETSLPSVIVGVIICLVAAVTLVHDTLPADFLWPWFVAQVVLTAWRIRTFTGRHASSGRLLRRFSVDRQLRAAVIHSTISGTLWGAFGYVGMSSLNPQTDLVVIMLLTGLVAGATALVSHLPRVYYPYTLTMMVPVIAYLLVLDPGGEQRWIGWLLLLYLLFSMVAARAASLSVGRAIELGFRNAELVGGLRDAHQAAEGERRRAEAALGRERNANLSKSRFLAAASHDLRQPLHSLRLHLATLRTQTRGTRHEGALRMMAESASALDELFDALLDVSKLDAGTLEPDLDHAPLAPLLERLESDFAPIAGARNLELRVGRTRGWVHTDMLLLERLLRNLLTNAVRYTESGGVRIDIDDAAKACIDLQIVDTGPGIAPEDRVRVFEEFVQLENPERDRSQGIGLGLSIVRRIADLLGFALSLRETPGGGTTVSILVPRGQYSERPREPEPAPIELDDTQSAPPIILVIDDEEAVRVAMEDFLEEHDCMALTVDSGDEAIRTLVETACVPDAIVCDYRLRANERGTEAVARVRAHCGREVPAVLITGDIGVDGLRDIRDSGLQVLHKPCDPARLLEVLRRPGRVAGTSEASRGRRAGAGQEARTDGRSGESAAVPSDVELLRGER